MTKLDVGTLAACIAANRFLPVPPPERCFIGDGDFRAIGAEFLRHFVEWGGLQRNDRVLEIGCGIGRMALPLTQYLDAQLGTYDGIDVVRDGIDWCRETVTPVYGNFRFHHRDFRNDVYNPQGGLAVEATVLPFPDRHFDFVFMTSVVTHLRQADTQGYIREIGRMLRPAGRCFVSLFLMNERARAGLRTDSRRLAFDPDAAGPEYLADPEHPSAAVAYDEPFIVEAFAAAGMIPARPFAYGHWATGEGHNYQDLCLFEKTAEARR